MKNRYINSRGDTDILVVVIVIIGAFLFIGGQFFFQKVEKPTNKTTSPGSSSLNSEWKIEQVANTLNCDKDNNRTLVDIAFYGTQNGHFIMEVKDGTDFKPVSLGGTVYHEFVPSSNVVSVTLDLPNSKGFNTKPWRAVLFQGGTVSDNTLTGGSEKAKQEFPPTEC